MSKEITVHFSEDTREPEDHLFVDNLYDLSWQDYRPIEKVLKMNAVTNRDGEIQEIKINEDEFIVKFQEALAKAILKDNNIELSEVKAKTVKKIIEEYGEDHEELNLKLKKKRGKSEA